MVESGVITSDELTAGGFRVWLTGHDPVTGEERGHQRLSPDADLLLDARPAGTEGSSAKRSPASKSSNCSIGARARSTRTSTVISG
ncbi:hypothetical protein ACIGCK_09555 [Microbacterium sp. NPDC078428]|uniref:hypothetical protein n=1 Tax=Microbacterium sp. NPDC078428 TaxID=3364190 RepID=UPI0037C662AD